MDALTFLSQHVPFFAGLNEEELTALAINSTLGKFNAGQIVLRAGLTVETLYVVANGKVEVHAKVPNKGMQCVAELAQGEVFGEASILEETVATATIKASPNGAIVLLIPEEPFKQLITNNTTFAKRVRDLISQRKNPK